MNIRGLSASKASRTLFVLTGFSLLLKSQPSSCR